MAFWRYIYGIVLYIIEFGFIHLPFNKIGYDIQSRDKHYAS